MLQAARLVWLDQADARDPALVGAKAARLARARSSGLPVLDGFVVSSPASASAISRGEKQFRTRNSGAARTAVFHQEPSRLLSELAEAAARLGDAVVVRSSSRVEADGIWAGAFSSYLDVRPQEVATGVIGCWASVFNPGALQRAEALGISPSKIGMAVLVQTQVQTVWGGVATVADGRQIKIAGMAGHHAPLVAGWKSGHLATVDHDHSIHQTLDSPLPPKLIRQVAHLARWVRRDTGDTHIEWAMGENGEVYLLQAQPTPDRRVTHLRSQPPRPLRQAAPELVKVVLTMLRYPDRLGERLVWPWAIGLSQLPAVRPGRTTGDPATLMAELENHANLLVSQRWPALQLPRVLELAWAQLRKGDQSAMLELLSQAEAVDPHLAETHLQKLGELADALTQAGVIPNGGWMWYQDPDQVGEPKVRGGKLSRRIGIGKWDPLIFNIIVSQGTSLLGHPAAGGWGAGRLQFITSATNARALAPRTVIAADLPIGNLAPLLWNAAGLITRGGSPGAHLFEVAQWLGVPAICGVELQHGSGGSDRHTGEEDLMVAVDGDRGEVTYLPR